jgi:hypothetical protein
MIDRANSNVSMCKRSAVVLLHRHSRRLADYMGQCARSESRFYCFRIEDQVPENHLRRLIDQHISFDFVREATGAQPLGASAGSQERARREYVTFA